MICIFHHTECMITFFLPILSYFWDIFLSEEDSMYLIFIFIWFDHKEIVIPHFCKSLKKSKFTKPPIGWSYWKQFFCIKYLLLNNLEIELSEFHFICIFKKKPLIQHALNWFDWFSSDYPLFQAFLWIFQK